MYKVTILVVSVIMVILASGCGMTKNQFDSLINEVEIPRRDIIKPKRGEPQLENRVEDGVGFQVSKTPVKEERTIEDFVILNPNAGEIWPGNIVQYEGLKRGILNPVGLEFGERTITIDKLSDKPLGRPLSKTISKAGYGNINHVLSQLALNLPQITAATMGKDIKKVHSLEHAKLEIGLGANWPSGSISGFFSEENFKEKTNLIISFSQSYFTVSAKRPDFPSEYFEFGVFKPREIRARNYMGEGNPPCFVSSVTYGRRFIVHVSSSISEEKVNAALNVVVNFATSGGHLDLSAETKRVLNQSHTRVLVVGGSASDAVEFIDQPNPETLIELVRKGANISKESPGVPISYTVRFLSNNKTAAVGIPAEWTEVTEKRLYRQPFRVKIVHPGLVFLDVADDDEDLNYIIDLTPVDENGNPVGKTERIHRHPKNNGSFVNQYVEEYGKYSGDKCKNNCFEIGYEIYRESPVYGLKYHLEIASLDGDGFKWGIEDGIIKPITGDRHIIEFKPDGHLKIHFQFSK